MTFESFLKNVRRIVEDDGLRWDDSVIAEYLVDNVNEIFRKTGGAQDILPLDLVQGQYEYPLTVAEGRIETIKIRPENSVEDRTLQQVQLFDLPTDYSTESDPNYYALTTVDATTGAHQSNQIIVFDSAPARTTNGAVSGAYGIYISLASEWAFSSAESASATELATVIPVLSKFDRHLTNMVAGTLMLEMNDAAFVQKGMALTQTAGKYIADIAYQDSLSFYTYNPGRLFP